VTSQISQSCGEDSKEVAGWPIDRIEQTITPTVDQRALLDDFANASIRAAQTIKEACPTSIAFAPTGRLDSRGWCRRSTSSGLRSTSFMHR
jgi:hypothetical protein